MTETNSENNQEHSQSTQSDLAAELNRLGENLGKLLKVAWESDERKSVERELKTGLEQFNKQINSAVEQTKTDRHMKKAKESIKDAWQTAHGPQVINELHMGLVDSLKKMNDEIAKRAEPKPAHEVKVEVADETPPAPVEEVKPE